MKGLSPLEQLIASDSNVRLLFVTEEIDHFCELLIHNPLVAKDGLLPFVIEPIERVIDNLYENGDGASDLLLSSSKLFETATNILRMMNLNTDPHGETLIELSDILEKSWSALSHAASANRIWMDLDEKIAIKIAASKLQAQRRIGKGKISQSSKDRIQKIYQERVNNGHKYGAIKELSYQFGYSEATIKTIIKGLN
jgi:hypothetical protein